MFPSRYHVEDITTNCTIVHIRLDYIQTNTRQSTYQHQSPCFTSLKANYPSQIMWKQSSNIWILIVTKGESPLLSNQWAMCALCKLKVSTLHSQCLLELNNDLTVTERIITVEYKLQSCGAQQSSGLTSFVFQRCRWDGKWSDLGRDSRLSGSLIGSPSEINIFILH